MSFSKRFNILKHLKGAGDPIINPMESMIKNTYTFINLALRNQVGQRVADLADTEAGKAFMTKEPAPFTVTTVELDELIAKGLSAKSMEEFEDVPEITAEFGNKVLLVTTPASVPPLQNQYSLVKKLLTDKGLEVHHFDGVVPNPTVESISAGAIMARESGAEVLIGLGG